MLLHGHPDRHRQGREQVEIRGGERISLVTAIDLDHADRPAIVPRQGDRQRRSKRKGHALQVFVILVDRSVRDQDGAGILEDLSSDRPAQDGVSRRAVTMVYRLQRERAIRLGSQDETAFRPGEDGHQAFEHLSEHRIQFGPAAEGPIDVQDRLESLGRMCQSLGQFERTQVLERSRSRSNGSPSTLPSWTVGSRKMSSMSTILIRFPSHKRTG